MKPNLFLDFDGLKFNTTPPLISYMNQRWNINSVESDYINNNDSLETIINKHRKDIVVTYGEVYEDIGENYNISIERQQYAKPIKNMRKITKLLSGKYRLWTVTSRQIAGIHVIQYLLDKHIPGCISGIHCVYEHIGGGNFKKTSKRDFIESVPGEKVAFIDDSPNEIKDMGTFIPSYLFDPKRLHDSLPQIQNRIYSWEQIGEKFL